ncbi:MAG TPA: urate hydroxylase PuuD, partial [Terriglobia bacterium]|nr:urate hydroxylase PuuD [Terriglobia bacterium]
MEGPINDILNLLFRWLHVIAGILWIGHLWYFNFVNSQVAKTYDDDSKRKVVPELMPRALFWFRFGAVFTWVTGFLLLGMVYYGGGAMVYPEQSLGLAVAVGIGSLIVAVPIYDLTWKALAKNEMLGVVVSFVLLAGATLGLRTIMSGRALFIHLGAIFGTI